MNSEPTGPSRKASSPERAGRSALGGEDQWRNKSFGKWDRGLRLTGSSRTSLQYTPSRTRDRKRSLLERILAIYKSHTERTETDSLPPETEATNPATRSTQGTVFPLPWSFLHSSNDWKWLWRAYPLPAPATRSRRGETSIEEPTYWGPDAHRRVAGLVAEAAVPRDWLLLGMDSDRTTHLQKQSPKIQGMARTEGGDSRGLGDEE